jgi:hypothetical protein
MNVHAILYVLLISGCASMTTLKTDDSPTSAGQEGAS